MRRLPRLLELRSRQRPLQSNLHTVDETPGDSIKGGASQQD